MSVISIGEKARFIESAFGPGDLARNGKNISVRCPIPECESRKVRTKRKLAIRLDDDANHCWVCGWKARSLLPLLYRYVGPDYVAKYREKYYSGPLRAASDSDVTSPAVRLPADFLPLATTRTDDPDVRAAVRYVANRGLVERDLWFYRLGVSNEPRWRRRVIVPSFSANGNVNHFVARAIDPKRYPKYDGPDNVHSHELVFNELHIDWSSPLVVCEGPFDLVKCGFNATCLLGSNLNEDSALFEAVLVHKTPILLALDDDMSKKIQRFSRKLAEYDISVSIVPMGKRHDPGEMTQQEFQAAAALAEPWSWHGMIATRLASVQTRMRIV